jgi:hypothetical protein
MGERDAFGREKGEDSLASMGWKPAGAPARDPATVTPGDPPAPEPAASVFDAGEAAAPFARPKPRPAEPEPAAVAAPLPAEPPRPRPPAPTFSRPRRRRGGPSVARLGLLIAFLGILAIGVAKAVEVGGDAVDDIKGRIEAIDPEQTAPSPAAAGSLLRAAPLRDALTKLPPGKLVFVRISADSVDAQVIRGGKRHTVHMSTTGPNAEVTSPAGVDQDGFKLNPAAPLRAVRTAARRAGLSADDLDYIVGTEQGWTLFFKNGGPRYQASLSGRNVKKL